MVVIALCATNLSKQSAFLVCGFRSERGRQTFETSTSTSLCIVYFKASVYRHSN